MAQLLMLRLCGDELNLQGAILEPFLRFLDPLRGQVASDKTIDGGIDASSFLGHTIEKEEEKTLGTPTECKGSPPCPVPLRCHLPRNPQRYGHAACTPPGLHRAAQCAGGAG